jgi:HEAT repeat protein
MLRAVTVLVAVLFACCGHLGAADDDKGQTKRTIIEGAFRENGLAGVVSAAKALEKERGSTEAAEALSRLLSNDDAQLRAAAAHALGMLGQCGEKSLLDALQSIKAPRDERLVPMLIAGLSHDNFDLQWYAAVHLGNLKGKAAPAWARLVHLLENESKEEKRPGEFFTSSQVRAKAAFALGQIGTELEQTERLLTRLMRHKDPEIRISSALGLGQMGEKAKAAVPVLIESLADEKMILKPGGCFDSAHPDHSAATALVNIGTPALPALIQALGSKLPGVRRHAADALWYFGTEAKPAADTLLRLLRDDDATVRRQAAHTLLWIGTDAKRLIPEMVRLTHDKDDEVRAEAAVLLSCLKPKGAVPLASLIRLLDDPTPAVRGAAFAALEIVAPRQVLESSIARLLKDNDEENRNAALQAQENLREQEVDKTIHRPDRQDGQEELHHEPRHDERERHEFSPGTDRVLPCRE